MSRGVDVVRHETLIGASQVAAPLLMLVGDGASAWWGGEAFWVATVALWLSFLAYVFAALGMTRMAGEGPLAMTGLGVTTSSRVCSEPSPTPKLHGA